MVKLFPGCYVTIKGGHKFGPLSHCEGQEYPFVDRERNFSWQGNGRFDVTGPGMRDVETVQAEPHRLERLVGFEDGVPFTGNADGTFSRVPPSPFYWGLLPWLWRRITGWRDEYGRKAAFIGWRG